VSVRADIFSLGCLIYELMTGTFPYEGQSDKDIKDWYSRGIFPNTKALGPAGSVITKCWQGKHARCAEVVKDLKRCQKPRGTISPVLESHPGLASNANQPLTPISRPQRKAQLPRRRSSSQSQSPWPLRFTSCQCDLGGRGGIARLDSPRERHFGHFPC
jgi:serine/threonine protein kinase